MELFKNFKQRPQFSIEPGEASVWLYAVDEYEQQWAIRLDPEKMFGKLMGDNAILQMVKGNITLTHDLFD